MIKKQVIQKNADNPFDIRDGRAMVSVGPLSPKKYCSYSCPFCYVNAGFLSYASKTIQETLQWLQENENDFNIIYISGDTDSFAHPRTDEGLNLLEGISNFNVDVLFTTRAIFSEEQYLRIEAVKEKLKQKNKLLFGCVSIAQLNQPHLEPRPIPSPFERIKQLNRFKELGLVSILAMRPFLPNVSINDYLELVGLVEDKVDIILGEIWYTDKNGILESATFNGNVPNELNYIEHEMDFDDNLSIWRVYELKEIEEVVKQRCKILNIPFYMRSSPAIEWARNKYKNDF